MADEKKPKSNFDYQWSGGKASWGESARREWGGSGYERYLTVDRPAKFGEPPNLVEGSKRVMADDDKLTDARIAASEARTETKFAELRGEMKLMSAEISTKLDRVLSKVESFDTRLSEPVLCSRHT